MALEEYEPQRCRAVRHHVAWSSRLRDACLALHEDPKRLSEPDVLLAWSDLLVFIEVKYGSPNERKPDYENFWRYLDREELFAVSTNEVEQKGYYELVRNWRIGIELAASTPFILVNLGPRTLECDASRFAGQLKCAADRQFKFIARGDLVAHMRRSLILEKYLEAFITERQLDTSYA